MRQSRHRVGLFALFALMLAACTVGPDFKRPTAGSDAGYLPATGRAEGAAPELGQFEQHALLGATAVERWWTLFDSAHLDALVRQAVSENHSLAAARATLEQTEQLRAAQAGVSSPELGVNGGAGREKLGAQFLGPFRLPPFGYVAANLSLRYVLDYNGALRRSLEQQAALAQFERSEVDAAYLTLTGSVVTEALLVATSREQIQAATELLHDDRQNVDLVRTEFENGSVSRVDVLTAETQLASDMALLPPLRQQLSVAEHALAILIGRTPAQWSSPALTLGEFKLPREVPVSVPSELVHRRPDILAAEAQLHAATAALGVATANLYPQLVLTGTAGQQTLAGTPAKLFDASSTAWSAIAGLTQPLYDGGRLKSQQRAARDALRVSAERYQQVVLQSFGQVADLLEALNHNAELVAAQSSALAKARETLELVRESYGAGNSGLLQVLDAQRQLQQARLGLLRAEAQQYLDTVQLLLASGGAPLEQPTAAR